MTPYRIGSVITQNFLGSVPNIGYWLGNRLVARYRIDPVDPNYPDRCGWYGWGSWSCYSRAAQFDYSHWNEVGDYDKWSSELPLVTLSSIDDSQVIDAIVKTREESAKNSYCTYDALTDILQLKQTVSELCSVTHGFNRLLRRFLSGHALSDLNIARSMKPKHLLHSSNRALRKIGKSWMAYRYSIMPNIYSYRDIIKVLQRGYLTRDHKLQTIPVISGDSGADLPAKCITKQVTGSIQVRSTVACIYSTQDVAQRASLGFNILSTAWEFIPYSWVVDWFVNAGDYITANLSADLADFSEACTSVLVKKKEIYSLHYQ